MLPFGSDICFASDIAAERQRYSSCGRVVVPAAHWIKRFAYGTQPLGERKGAYGGNVVSARKIARAEPLSFRRTICDLVGVFFFTFCECKSDIRPEVSDICFASDVAAERQ